MNMPPKLKESGEVAVKEGRISWLINSVKKEFESCRLM